MFIQSNLKKYRDIWPINEKTSQKPEWFTEWPGGKKFALIITHDVEKRSGLKNVDKLLAIDEKYSVTSSFGLVPERYTVTKEMLDFLREHKREIYVHDLNHDGKLFSNYTTFHKRAPSINEYIKQWNVHGFRAGAMHHNLDWIGELDVKYDMSTFDTDPFEPMPDGVDTIFPFIAESPSTNRKYVEIPYTLPQDLLTLILHPARSIDIWIKKLDWISAHSGMVLVNVHPDYISFSDEENSFDKYSVSLYEEFLSYVKERYGDVMWNPLPSEMSRFVCGNKVVL